MKVDDALVEKLSKLSRLEFSDEAKENIKEDLKKMIDFVEHLNDVDTDGIEPLIHVNPEKNIFRADEVTQKLSQKEALKNAPSHDDFYFKVPKVVDNPDRA
jgi:aspartyl-tRNA(Asn)/glutamyl-tRNA(Gln) amidotransferase subunit C